MTFIDENGNREEYRPLNPWLEADLDKKVVRLLQGRLGQWVTFNALLQMIDWGDKLSRQQEGDARLRLRDSVRRLLRSGSIQRRHEGQAAYRVIDTETMDLFEAALTPGRREANASTSAVGGTFHPADGKANAEQRTEA